MLAVADDSALHLLEFVDRRALPNELSRLQLQAGCALGIGRSVVSAQLKAELTQYFNKTLPWFEVPVIQHGQPLNAQSGRRCVIFQWVKLAAMRRFQRV